jgi:hypothetical protein
VKIVGEVKMSRSIDVEDGRVTTGDDICFKEDHEKSGTVVSIDRDGWIQIEYYDDYTGETHQTTKHADRCWVEG